MTAGDEFDSDLTILSPPPSPDRDGVQTSGGGSSRAFSHGTTTITPQRQKEQQQPQQEKHVQSSPSSTFTYDSKGQLNDPNLTDDTFVVEAPSFIVPYVYEKPPKETFKEFKDSIAKCVEEKAKANEEKKRNKVAKQKKKKSGSSEEDEESEEEEKSDEDKSDGAKSDEEEDAKKEDDNKDKDADEDIVEIKDDAAKPAAAAEAGKPKSENFFESSLGKFFVNLGMNLVQEAVQVDLLKQQIKKSHKDRSASVMHAIKSLKQNIEDSKDDNKEFHFELKKCKFCSFRSESDMVIQNHLETPHMKAFMYRCNFCKFETKIPQEVLSHMFTTHGVRGKLERAPAIHQCPQCPFEDNMKGKMTRHRTGCDKRFRPEVNQNAPHDWEPPAKIPKPPMSARQQYGVTGMQQQQQFRPQQHQFRPAGPHQSQYGVNRPGGGVAGSAAAAVAAVSMNIQPKPGGAGIYQGMPQLQMGPRGRGRPVGTYGPGQPMGVTQQFGGFGPVGRGGTNLMVPTQIGSGSVTIQSLASRQGGPRGSTQPSISITPLPGSRNASPSSRGSPGGRGQAPGAAAAGQGMSMKPGQPGAGQTKDRFVICEICDGYIKDLEQLRNHMQWIHKVKIHPKMIYNRPPLNCQKCQFRFFTDQGLERHLLGSHGLVTASMQDMANKGQDAGRCPVCGKVYQWKLLNHVAKDHQKTLKPAHLSYKCTVCTATFGQYKLFENHVYTAHSGAAKKADKAKQQQLGPSAAGGGADAKAAAAAAAGGALKAKKLSSEVSIMPQTSVVGGPAPKSTAAAAAAGDAAADAAPAPANKANSSASSGGGATKSNPDPDVIELDDDDDAEKSNDSEVINLGTPKASAATSASVSQNNSDDDEDEGDSSDEEENQEDGVPKDSGEEEGIEPWMKAAAAKAEDPNTKSDDGIEPWMKASLAKAAKTNDAGAESAPKDEDGVEEIEDEDEEGVEEIEDEEDT